MSSAGKSQTSESLREILFAEIQSLRDGKSDATRAGAISKLAAQIIESARADIEFTKYSCGPDGVEFTPLTYTGSKK